MANKLFYCTVNNYTILCNLSFCEVYRVPIGDHPLNIKLSIYPKVVAGI